ncbi:AraC family transcriptional regulator [Paenibacillus flagellatus]|uniref:AraC family transcriptional regulator n=1 Tax=Paenibacillus flagellatus TaxID=2211139 RepID=A0A2V5KM46_9BACL|nr:AraC family transcriptional regulator [Paenibacillus flagellatus]
MELLKLRTNLQDSFGDDVPVSVYTVGTEHQSSISRLKGFSANQLFVTFSGTGLFRTLDRDKDISDTVGPNTLLYIPAGLPHQYWPQGEAPWSVGYVTFVENRPGFLAGWGFGDSPIRLPLARTDRLHELLGRIWRRSGPDDFDPWGSTELLLAFCVEAKKQAALGRTAATDEAPFRTVRYRDSAVDSAVRFLHDHLQRDLTMTELAAHVGYSPKQLSRLFVRSLGSTPLQYWQRLRLHTAALLLAEQPGMTVRQAAAHIGMEPVYFTRLFRRTYGVVPSAYKARDREGSPY